MHILLFALLISCLSMSASAQQVQFKQGSIAIGDSVEQLLKVAGKPDQVRPFPGAPGSTLYEYSVGDRQVNVSTRNGKVTGIADNTIIFKPTPARPSGVELNGRNIATGDSLAKLLEIAPQPDRIRTIDGSPELSVYEYSFTGRQVTVTVRGDKILGTSETKVKR